MKSCYGKILLLFSLGRKISSSYLSRHLLPTLHPHPQGRGDLIRQRSIVDLDEMPGDEAIDAQAEAAAQIEATVLAMLCEHDLLDVGDREFGDVDAEEGDAHFSLEEVDIGFPGVEIGELVECEAKEAEAEDGDKEAFFYAAVHHAKTK